MVSNVLMCLAGASAVNAGANDHAEALVRFTKAHCGEQCENNKYVALGT